MLDRLAEAWHQQQLVTEQQRQLVSNVSHELRTPLTIIGGYLQSTLRRCDNLSETQVEGLKIAAVETDQTIRLLQELLDLARADSGHMRFNQGFLNLNDLVKKVIAMTETFSHRPVRVEASSPNISVYADADRLKQALLNLVENAIKYSEDGTPIIIKIKSSAQNAMIDICDCGYGISLQHQSRIFERFYRVDESRTRATGGTGLGLSLV